MTGLLIRYASALFFGPFIGLLNSVTLPPATSTMFSSYGTSPSRSGMASAAFKRLMQEYKELTINPPEGITAGPVEEDNFFEWETLIMGPPGTAYEGGVFTSTLTFPYDYPLNPPKMKFTCEMWHPNVYPNGEVCISILHPPGEDPNQYESSAERWSPVQSVEKILLSVVSMLAEPNIESPANIEAAKMWRDNRKLFQEKVVGTVRSTLGLS